ncbi:MAG: VWA domain-containing protein [Desulfurococcales archaeon]|nr:VWA domain-containing protein [Desulfurococcales archaeon]
MRDTVIALDVSPSMGKPSERIRPSKLSVARDALAYALSRLLSRVPRARVGLVVFYRRAYPLLPLTSDARAALKALSLARILGSGTAPGEAVIEAVKLLRRSHREKSVLLVTDGGFNEGIHLEYSAYYARYSGVRLDVATLGEEPHGRDRASIEEAVKLTGGTWLHASKREEVYSVLSKILAPPGA